jgi:hypothetical protein
LSLGKTSRCLAGDAAVEGIGRTQSRDLRARARPCSRPLTACGRRPSALSPHPLPGRANTRPHLPIESGATPFRLRRKYPSLPRWGTLPIASAEQRDVPRKRTTCLRNERQTRRRKNPGHSRDDSRRPRPRAGPGIDRTGNDRTGNDRTGKVRQRKEDDNARDEMREGSA